MLLRVVRNVLVAAVPWLLITSCSSASDADSDRDRPASSEVAVVAGGEEGEEGDGSDHVFPGDEWEAVTPEEAGIDRAVLDSMAEKAVAAQSDCLLVVRDGRLVAEWYWDGMDPEAPQEVWSASKSFTSTFIGMASDDGDLDVGDEASEYIPQWQGTPAEEVTVANLLSNDSGRHYDYQTDYIEMAAKAQDKTAFAVGLGQDAPPGEVWAYNNSAIQTLEGVFEAATGEDMADFAQRRLFEPTGMADTSLKRDVAGNPLAFMGIQSTCRDMARFGHLMLRGGEWDGERIVSEDWVEAATDSSQQLNAGYGWLWWVNDFGPQEGDQVSVGEGAAKLPAEPGHLVEGAPEDMFYAQGMGGQVIAVDPGSETVVVRMGPPVYPEGTPKFRSADASAVARSLAAGS